MLATASTGANAADFFGGNNGEWKQGPNGPYWDESDWPEWTPMYWMEEFMDSFDGDNSWGGNHFGFGNNNYGSPYGAMPAMPYGGYGNILNRNWGNNRNGSGFNNGFNNGSNWNMPNMNWSNNRNGSGFNNGFSNGSNWNMPNLNWGNNNGNRGSNWNMPSFNTGLNNIPGQWNPNQNYNAYVQPNRIRPNRARPHMVPQQKQMPRIPVVPRVQQTIQKSKPQQKGVKSQFPPAQSPAKQMKRAPQKSSMDINNSIPKPSDIKGVILAPENKVKAATK